MDLTKMKVYTASVLLALQFSVQLSVSGTLTSPVSIQINKNNISKVDEKFLSFTMDTSSVKDHFPAGRDIRNSTLIKLASVFSPGLFRMGGGAADYLIFVPDSEGDSYKNAPKPTFNMTASEWEAINDFAALAGLQLLFDLNDELRKGGSWDSSNAEELLKVTAEKKYAPIWWQLGNEPNLYPEAGLAIVTGEQLAKDFQQLKTLLAKYPSVGNVLIGPDVTKPAIGEFMGGIPAGTIMEDFLKEIAKLGDSIISHVTWHHYYVSGRTATLDKFINADVYDLFIRRAGVYVDLVDQYLPGTPMAVTETGSAFGGGALGLSNAFVSCLIWLDELGVAAALKQQFLCKQDLVGGHYSLLNTDYQPLPLYWVSVLHKQLMGAGVLQIEGGLELKRTARIYAHCTAQPSQAKRLVPSYPTGSVTLSVINLRNESITIATNLMSGSKDLYLLHSKNLTSQDFYLNDVFFPMRSISTLPSFKPDVLSPQEPVVFPPLSCGFVVFWQAKLSTCM